MEIQAWILLLSVRNFFTPHAFANKLVYATLGMTALSVFTPHAFANKL